MNLAICICTYNRNNKLTKCLDSIEKINLLNKFSIKIIIVDNSINKNSYLLIKNIRTKFKYKILYFSEKRRGVVYARNRCLKILKKINPTYACFFDDDCVVDKQWFINVLKIKQNKKASIITGPQLHKNPIDYKGKGHGNYQDLFEKKFEKSTEVKWAATNNVFFKYDILKKNQIYFDIKLNKFGMGEDQLFFSILNKKGNKIFWHEEIKVYETSHKDRSEISWIQNRSYRLGVLGHYIDIAMYGKTLGYFINYLKSIFFLLNSIKYSFLFFFTYQKRIETTLNLYRFYGKLMGPFVIKKISF
jgi:succinoglycan biosynthesis protein ExoM